ncbi:N-formylglutamate deformylase [Sneathiella sp. HT1-7]|jgi:N-formylglutamate deformylase|uniref:N-formylglutamate deformylase n=1 Tax=Sneathiella sp. HT1-7 TaxID=2887192 RepID=UPI001D143FB9|nr:N-formylglutamate deformylase [Sneathiella sp. HT1-7]MCC3305716.1 N-formylglutamate deformylase [Sneathiella sp. HT1-7]
MQGDVFTLTRGSSPLLLSQPHAGLDVPASIERRLTEAAKALPDTDWHIHRLYQPMAKELDATVLTARFSRYVIDLNRDPDGAPLYPGQSVTELCPTTLFDNSKLYQDGLEPDIEEIETRRGVFWQPYHDVLTEEIERIKAIHGYVLLYDCHSIRSVIPRFFDGRLPSLNIGTGDGISADADLTESVENIAAASPYSHALNGRFKGGYITRHYGDPTTNIHALQMELAQEDYMQEETPFSYLPEKAAALQPTLKLILETMLDFGRNRVVT